MALCQIFQLVLENVCVKQVMPFYVSDLGIWCLNTLDITCILLDLKPISYNPDVIGQLYIDSLRYDLIDSDHIAFMFDVGTFPDLSIHPIDTNICTRHLRHNI